MGQITGKTRLPRRMLPSLQRGALAWSYKGRSALKCPFDLALYLDVLWEVKPATVLEFGSNRGGSALWLADTLTAYGLAASRVFSFDIAPVTDLADPRITFGYCDVAEPARHLDAGFLAALPHPLLVIDDASHQADHVLAVLRCVDPHLRRGDYVIVEDGILTRMGWGRRYGGGPLAALATFLAEAGDRYEVDRARCDAFGTNVTWNVDGYLRRL